MVKPFLPSKTMIVGRFTDAMYDPRELDIVPLRRFSRWSRQDWSSPKWPSPLSTPLRMCRVCHIWPLTSTKTSSKPAVRGWPRWDWRPLWRLKPRLGHLGSIRIGKVSCGLWVPSCAKLRLGASHWLVRQVYRPFEASKCSGFRQLKLVKVHFWPKSLTIFWGWKDQAASFKLSLQTTFWGNSGNSLDITALSTSQSSQTMIIGSRHCPRCTKVLKAPTVRTLCHEDFLKKGVIRFLSDSSGAASGCHWLSPATCGLVDTRGALFPSDPIRSGRVRQKPFPLWGQVELVHIAWHDAFNLQPRHSIQRWCLETNQSRQLQWVRCQGRVRLKKAMRQALHPSHWSYRRKMLTAYRL